MYRYADIRHLAVCKATGNPIGKDAFVLDFGCGAGQRVYQIVEDGYANTFGFDIADYLDLRDPGDIDRFRFSDDGTVPFPDEFFDLIVSDQVFEHVMDQEGAFREIHRTLKKGGVSVHVFPAKWRMLEPHIRVPLGGIIKSYPYYYFWALAGVRNQFQRKLSARETARKNTDYAASSLNYLSGRQYQRVLEKVGFSHSWEELAYMKASAKPRVRQLGRLSEKLPPLRTAIRTLSTRVLFLKKPAFEGATQA